MGNRCPRGYRDTGTGQCVPLGPSGSWIGFSEFQDYMEEEEGTSLDFDEYGGSAMGKRDAHIDIYEGMKYEDGRWLVDWEKSPEIKRDDLKDFFAVYFGPEDWYDKYIEYLEWSEERD